VLWRDGAMLDLGAPAGTQHAKPTGINEAGQVVGYAYNTAENIDARAFLWDNGTFRDLGALDPGDTVVRANAINNLGQVVGSSGVISGPWHAFLWQDGRMQALSAAESAAYAINDAGQIIGLDGTQPVLWQSGTRTPVPLGAQGSRPNAINAHGQVVGVGVTDTPRRCWCGALWDASGAAGVRYLADEAIWTPAAINDAGQVVGGAWLWQDGEPVQLGGRITGGAPLEPVHTLGINSKGQIVGDGRDPLTGIAQRALLLEPVTTAPGPENPGTTQADPEEEAEQ
jgi:probable HAF family extracellular repeat protein